MREIKFRGQRVDNREWVYGDLEYCRLKNLARIHIYDKEGYYKRQHFVYPETVGQFTGMCDKKGKEIYEGDIVKVCNDMSCHEHIGVVTLKNGCFGVYNAKECSFHTLYLKTKITNNRGATIKVNYEFYIIGNVHDNPELLETEE